MTIFLRRWIWAAASSQRTLYRFRAEAHRWWLFFQSGRQRYGVFL